MGGGYPPRSSSGSRSMGGGYPPRSGSSAGGNYPPRSSAGTSRNAGENYSPRSAQPRQDYDSYAAGAQRRSTQPPRSASSTSGNYPPRSSSAGNRSAIGNYPPRSAQPRHDYDSYGEDAQRRSTQPPRSSGSAGGSYPPRSSSAGNRSTGGNYPPRSSSASSTGGNYPPRSSSAGNRSANGNNPPRSAQPRSGYDSYAAGAQRRSTQPPRSAAPQRRSAPRKRGDNILLKILKGIGLAFFAIFAGIGKLLSALNHKLDVFRKSETSAVIVNAIMGGVIVTIALCVLMSCKPGIDSARARSSAAAGNAEKAMKLVSSLEAEGYDAQKLEDTRAAVVKGFIQAGKYAEADAMLLEMQEGATRSELQQRSSYAHASALYEQGDYTQAAQMFYQLDAYEDSALRYADCRCALAILAWQEGNETSAHSLLLDVPDALERVTQAAHKIAGSDAEAQAILSADIFSAESLNQLEQTMEVLSAARSELPEGRIAAGKRHTLAVTGSGTALAAGDNSYGQCNVSGWSGIRQVAAGAYHSVGLRSDGTVVAVGDNSQNQCEVSGWTDVVAIAAASYDTIGLRSDGSVVASGMHSSLVSGWHDVTFVAGGSYSLGCLYDKGAMLSSHKGAQMELDLVLYDLSICGQVSVGVLYDGTMVSSFDGAPQWEGMVTVTACESGILGVGVDGQVHSFFYRAGDGVDLSVPGRAVEVESSGTHHVVLTEDGRVYAFGENDYGQCEVSAWQL